MEKLGRCFDYVIWNLKLGKNLWAKASLDIEGLP